MEKVPAALQLLRHFQENLTRLLALRFRQRDSVRAGWLASFAFHPTALAPYPLPGSASSHAV